MIVVDEYRYIGGGYITQTLASLSATSGQLQFNFDGPNWIGTTYPAIGGGYLYVQGSTCLQSDYISNGAKAWRTCHLPSPSSSALEAGGMPTYSNGVIYNVGYGISEVQTFEATTGNQLWSVGLSVGVSSYVTYGDDTLFVPFVNTPVVEGLSSTDGKSLWNLTTSAPVQASASYSGNFYFGTTGGTAYAVSSSGQILWTKQLGGSIESTPAVTNGAIYVGSSNGMLYSLKAADGSQNWNFTDSNPITASPAVGSNGVVYFADTSGMVYALSAAKGAIDWEYSTGVSITSSLAINNGYLYVVDTTGLVYAFEPAFGVSFIEGGLSSGTQWQITVGNQTKSSTNTTITFSLAPGNYVYLVAGVQGYSVTPAGGTLIVSGGDVQESITFTKSSFDVAFLETGLPSGLTWSVSLDAVKHISSTSAIVFSDVSNGFYGYTVGAPFGYQASPASGNFSVSGQNATISISFGLGWNLPSPPQNVTATGAVGLVQLSWNAPKSSGAPPGFTGTGVESYYVYRGNASGGEKYYGKVTAALTSFTDNSVTAGQIYFYQVTATNPVGQSSPSMEVAAQAVLLTVPPVMSPVVPNLEGSGIYLSWNAPSSNGGTPISGYVLCRGSTPGSITGCVTLPANRTGYLDSNNLAPGQTYYYTIKALNSQGQGDPSTPVSIVSPESIPGQPFWENPLFPAYLAVIVAVISVLVYVWFSRREKKVEEREKRLEEKEKALEKKMKELEKLETK